MVEKSPRCKRERRHKSDAARLVLFDCRFCRPTLCLYRNQLVVLREEKAMQLALMRLADDDSLLETDSERKAKRRAEQAPATTSLVWDRRLMLASSLS